MGGPLTVLGHVLKPFRSLVASRPVSLVAPRCARDSRRSLGNQSHLMSVKNGTWVILQLLIDFPPPRFLTSIMSEARRAAVPSVVRLARGQAV